MTLTEITTAMKAYNNIITNGNALVELYKQGSYFEYTKQKLNGSEYVHAYPGINGDGDLVFFMIPGIFDVSSTQDIAAHVRVCPIQQLLLGGSHVLPDLEAQKMRQRWLEEYQTWIPKQVHEPIGMFLAFKIPADDFQVDNTLINLALKKNAAATTGVVADVVVTNIDSTDVYNYDFATTVPPMPATLTTSYYLLSLV